MAEIVNLRRARKAKARVEKDAAATQNRALHGRTKAQKQKDADDKARASKLLDAHKTS